MSGTEEKIWLCREGKTEGPFNPSQLEALKTSGEFKKYSWIWSGASKAWTPLYPPPPPVAEEVVETVQAQKVSRPIAAICYDNRNVISGQIEYSISADSMLRSEDFNDMLPPFKKGAELSVHLLDDATGTTEKLQAKLVDFKKADSQWEYRLRWIGTPKLILPAAQP